VQVEMGPVHATILDCGFWILDWKKEDGLRFRSGIKRDSRTVKRYMRLPRGLKWGVFLGREDGAGGAFWILDWGFWIEASDWGFDGVRKWPIYWDANY
jgi:hypothetical protein